MDLIQEKQDMDEVMLKSLQASFLFNWLVHRERLQKSIALKTSHDSDSNVVHLFDFSWLVTVRTSRWERDEQL